MWDVTDLPSQRPDWNVTATLPSHLRGVVGVPTPTWDDGAMPDPTHHEPSLAEPILHRAARIEDAVQIVREQRARRRGLVPTVIPYNGYGARGVDPRAVPVLLTPRRGLPPTPRSTASAAGRASRACGGRRRGHHHTAAAPRTSCSPTAAACRHHRADRPRTRLAHHQALPPAACATSSGRVHRPPGHPVRTLLSDIDDTVMVTSLPRPMLARVELVRAHRARAAPRPGHVRAVRAHPRAQHPGRATVYLSTGA